VNSSPPFLSTGRWIWAGHHLERLAFVVDVVGIEAADAAGLHLLLRGRL